MDKSKSAQSTVFKEQKSVPRMRHTIIVKMFFAFISMALFSVIVTGILLLYSLQDTFSSMPPSHLKAVITDLKNQIFLLIIFAIIPSIALAFIVAQNIGEPIKKIISSVKKVGRGDLDAEIETNRRDELGSLAVFFNEMVRKLREIQERNKAISDLKSHFVKVAAHQLRTPTSAIRWALELVLKGNYGKISDEQKGLFEQINKSNSQVITIVNDLLNVARIEEGKFAFEFKEVEINSFISGILKKFNPESSQTKFNFSTKIRDGTKVILDPSRLSMALENILDNATKYSASNTEIEIALYEESGTLTISIANQGIGISQTERDNIFRQFYRGTNAIKKEPGGSGLGLYITKDIVDRHGGKIWFTSTEGGETKFFVQLPMKRELTTEKAEIEKFMEAM